jgi:alcohol dehydrogenase class IV
MFETEQRLKALRLRLVTFEPAIRPVVEITTTWGAGSEVAGTTPYI